MYWHKDFCTIVPAWLLCAFNHEAITADIGLVFKKTTCIYFDHHYYNLIFCSLPSAPLLIFFYSKSYLTFL